MDDELLKLISGAKYVSLDIYDTAIKRTVSRPIDIFELVAQKLIIYGYRGSIKKWPKLRISTEFEVRKNSMQQGREEINLDEIYNELVRKRIFSPEVAEKAKNLEIKTELEFCRRNDYIYDVYQYCISIGIPIIFISDMYLSKNVLALLLESQGYIFTDLFVSSTEGASKRTGALFKVVVERLGCEPSSILHIGDNYQSDVVMAMNSGYLTHFYRPVNTAVTHNRLFSRLPSFSRRTDMSDSVYRSSLELLSERNQISNYTSEELFWYNIGFKYVGVLLFSFTEWVIERAKKMGLEQLFFLSRDGYLMQKAYEIVSSHNIDAVPSKYIYLSRRVLNFPAIKELDISALDFLTKSTIPLKVGQFLRRIGIEPSSCEGLITELGFFGAEQLVTSERERSILQKLFIKLADEVLELARCERKVLTQYIRQSGVISSFSNIGIIDIGWNGSLQRSLHEIVTNPFGINIVGMYLALYEKAADLKIQKMDAFGYLCEFGNSKQATRTVKKNATILELIFTAPHGSVVGFNDNNGIIEPTFDTIDPSKRKLNKINKIHDGALDYVRYLSHTNRNGNTIQFSKDFASRHLFGLLNRPDRETASLIGDVEHVDGFGEVYTMQHIAKPSPGLNPFLDPYGLLLQYRRAYWKAGFRNRILTKNW